MSLPVSGLMTSWSAPCLHSQDLIAVAARVLQRELSADECFVRICCRVNSHCYTSSACGMNNERNCPSLGVTYMFFRARTEYACLISGLRQKQGIDVQLLLVDLVLCGIILFFDLLFRQVIGLSRM